MSETPEQPFVERRSDNRYITLQDVKAAINHSLLEHEVRERENMAEIIAALKQDIVPAGDTYQHREYHIKKINAAKAEEDFWVSAKKKVIENGIVGFFGVLKVVAGLGFLVLAVKLGITLPAWLIK